MTDTNQHESTRREFLRQAASLTVAAGLSGVLLEGCGAQVGVSETAQSTPESSFASTPRWEQDFSTLHNLDKKFWTIDTGNEIPGYNNEAQTLTNRQKNVRIENGQLIIEAHKEHLNGKKYTSGHINTQDKVTIKYGKVEVDLKAPKGVGTWPAAWLLANKRDAVWPDDGEIDFFEAVGAEPGKVIPDIHTHSTEHGGTKGEKVLNVPDLTRKFHTYGVELSPGKIVFTLDGKPRHTIKQKSQDSKEWPFDQEYFLILNLAMGGTWGGEKRDKRHPDGIKGDGPWQLAVKGVRIYDHLG